MFWIDIVTGVISNFVFVVLITLLLWLVNRFSHSRRLARAQEFFGFRQPSNITIFVSGFEHPGVRTKRVVNALEYEAAVQIKDVIGRLAGGGPVQKIARYFAGLIGQSLEYAEPQIEVSPLEDVQTPPRAPAVIVIGGPVSNQIARYYLRDTPVYGFNEATGKYQERQQSGYRDIEPSHDVAVIEKRIAGPQVAIITHGFGEEQTKRAIDYLSRNWEKLHSRYGAHEFGERV